MIYLFGILGVVFAALCGAVGFEHERLVSTQKKLQIANDQIKAAQDRATALALLWAAQVDKTEAEVKKEHDEAQTQIDALMARIKKGPDRIVVFDSTTPGLFTDIANAANATPAPAVSEPTAPVVPPPATPEALYDQQELEAWMADAAKAYRDARQKWQGCVNFYSGLQKGN